MIANLYLLIAAADLRDDLLPYKTESTYFNPVWKDVFLIVGGVAVLGIGLFIWAFMARQRHSGTSSGSSHSGSSRGLFSRRRKKRRHSRSREQWQRKPTLAETGGLPPPRDDESPPL